MMNAMKLQGRAYPSPHDDIEFAENILGIKYPPYLRKLYSETGGLALMVEGAGLLTITSLYRLASQYAEICELFGCKARDLKRLGLAPFAVAMDYGNLFLSSRSGHRVLGNVMLDEGQIDSETEWKSVEECVESYFDRALARTEGGLSVGVHAFRDTQIETMNNVLRPQFRRKMQELFAE